MRNYYTQMMGRPIFLRGLNLHVKDLAPWQLRELLHAGRTGNFMTAGQINQPNKDMRDARPQNAAEFLRS